MTACSADPNSRCRIAGPTARQTAPSPAATSVVTTISCLAARLAFSASSRPRYCAATIAPPVERAANTCSSRILIESTSETPETATSPTLATIRVSAMPMVAASTCSIISGTISRTRSFLVNKTHSTFSL